MSDFSPQSLAAARLFRTVMTAMARPGRMLDLAPCPEAEGACLPASLAIIATLCDYQTPVYLGQGLDAGAVQQRIRFETGAPLTREPGEAAMALVTAGTLREAMIHFARGTHEYPDRSTTVVVQLPVEGTGTARSLRSDRVIVIVIVIVIVDEVSRCETVEVRLVHLGRGRQSDDTVVVAGRERERVLGQLLHRRRGHRRESSVEGRCVRVADPECSEQAGVGQRRLALGGAQLTEVLVGQPKPHAELATLGEHLCDGGRR